MKSKKVTKTRDDRPDSGPYFLSFIGGSAVMFLQLAGGKIINSYFGASLPVWAAIISVSLTALALGYLSGSKIKNTEASKSYQSAFLISSFGIIISVIVTKVVFGFFTNVSVFVGAFLSSAILLGPILFYLGRLTPLIISHSCHITTQNVKVSRILFVSSLGGFVSAMLIGFILLPLLGVSYTLIVCAVTLLLPALKALKKKSRTIAVFVFLSLSLIIILKSNKLSSPEFKVVYDKEGVFGHVRVIDHFPPKTNFSTRRLLINGVTQTFIRNDATGKSFWNYPHFISAFSTIKDSTAKVLLLGLGGGSVARELQQQNFKVDAVEIDPRIIHVAKKYFYLIEKGLRVIQDEARRFIRRTNSKYDLVIYDVLTGEIQPEYVFTLESMKELKRVINKEAMVLINFQGIVTGTTDDAFQEMFSTFTHSGFYTQYFAPNPTSFDDIIFILSLKPVDLTSLLIPKEFNQCCKGIPAIRKLIKSPGLRFSGTIDKGWAYTDDRPNLQLSSLQAMAEWRKTMIKDITEPQRKSGMNTFK